MTVIDRIRAREAQHADLPAIIDGPDQWTHRELFDRVDRLSNAFVSDGMKPGDVLLCWLGNQHEAIECELACLQIGAVWVTLNQNLTWAEVASVVRTTQPHIVVSNCDLIRRGNWDQTDLSEFLGQSILYGVGSSSKSSAFKVHRDFEAAIAAADSARPRVDLDENNTARLRYTSGTTGTAKAAILPHRAYLGSLANLKEHLHPLSSSDCVLHAGPLTHASAALMYPILEAGGANVVLPSFDVSHVLETIAREKVTTMFAVPTMLRRMALSPDFDSHDLSRLKTISYGGAPMPVETIEYLIGRLGPVLMQIYGLTEALHPVTCLKREAHFVGNSKLGSAGTRTTSCAIEVRSQDGSSCDVGETGELWIKGPITFTGYWQDPDATSETLQDGWVASGDLGYCDEDDYYWIAGRKKDVIISGGFNVYAQEVEMVLLSHPEVEEAAVVGVPDSDWGERVTAVIWSGVNSDTDSEQLKAFCRERLAAYKTPKDLICSEDPLPKNNAGKIAKDAIRDLLPERVGG